MPFRDIIGHAHIIELLKHAAARERVPQSLLFAGPEGVGKHAMAVALAQAVNCAARRDGDACGVCSACVRIPKEQYSDVVVLEKGDEASIKIKALRERVLDVVGYRPFEGRRRVFIINPADDLTREAQDALLKTLEEPPSATILVLVTAYPDSLSATVQSRCRRLRFGLLSSADVSRVLETRAGLDRTTARRLAAISGGRVSRALEEEAGHLESDRDAAVALLGAAKTGSITARLRAAQSMAQHGSKRRDREAMSDRLAIVASLLRDLIALRVGDSATLANSDLEDSLRALEGAFDARRANDAFAAVTRAHAALERNASPKVVADWVAVTI